MEGEINAAPTEKPVFMAEYSARDNWVQYGDIRLEMRANQCFVRPLCQKLVEAGHPDGELRFRDPTMRHPYNFSVPSIHRMAAEPVHVSRDEHIQKVKEQAARRAERRALAEETAPVTAEPKPGRNSPPAAPDKKIIFVKVQNQTVRVNPMQHQAFDVLLSAPGEWETKVHGKTRNYMVAVGWVVVKDGQPALTNFGEEVWLAAAEALETYKREFTEGL